MAQSSFRFINFLKHKNVSRTLKLISLSSLVAYLHYNSNSKVQVYHDKTNEALNSIIEGCQDLKNDYKPTFWLSNNHLQTMYATLKKTPLKFPIKRETVKLKGDSEIYLDWIETQEHTEETPTIFVMPGKLKNL
jgi:hypothetical protein